MKTRTMYVELSVSTKSNTDVVRVLSTPQLFILGFHEKRRRTKVDESIRITSTIDSLELGVFPESMEVLKTLGLTITHCRMRGILDPDWLSVLHTISSLNKRDIQEVLHHD